MGRALKVMAVLVGLMLIPLGGWPVSALLFVYALGGLVLRGIRRQRGPSGTGPAMQTPLAQGAQVTPAVSLQRAVGHPVRRIMGLILLGLSAVALTKGGTYSPLVFGIAGATLLLSGAPFIRLGTVGSLRPVEESVLLRNSLVPFRWSAMAEVKLATKNAGKAVGGMDETLLVSLADGTASIFVLLKATSLSLRGAEESLLARLEELGRISAPLGAYLLPLDSAKAAESLRRSVEPVDLDSRGWPYSLSTSDYDLLTIEAGRGGFVHSVGAYRERRRGRSSEATAAFQPARQALSRPSLLWEAFQELGKKFQWPKPDAYATFLASMVATGGETVGERVSSAGSVEDSGTVLVQSLGTPPVQMSRAQLRAIARIYA
jgi:hypothetical protein